MIVAVAGASPVRAVANGNARAGPSPACRNARASPPGGHNAWGLLPPVAISGPFLPPVATPIFSSRMSGSTTTSSGSSISRQPHALLRLHDDLTTFLRPHDDLVVLLKVQGHLAAFLRLRDDLVSFLRPWDNLTLPRCVPRAA